MTRGVLSCVLPGRGVALRPAVVPRGALADAAFVAPVTQGCGHFNDTATLDSAADFLTDRAQNVAYGADRPLSTSIINYVVTTYPHLARLVHVDRSGSQITTVQYALASITGTILVCTNAPGYFAEPVAGTCWTYR